MKGEGQGHGGREGESAWLVSHCLHALPATQVAKGFSKQIRAGAGKGLLRLVCTGMSSPSGLYTLKSSSPRQLGSAGGSAILNKCLPKQEGQHEQCRVAQKETLSGGG